MGCDSIGGRAAAICGTARRTAGRTRGATHQLAVPARLATVLLLVAAPAAAQQELALADALARALANNRDLAVERENVRQAEAARDRADAAYDPVVRVDARYRDQTLPVTSILSGAPEGELAPTGRGVSGEARYTRLLETGATITFAGSLARDTSNSFLTLVSPAWLTAFEVEARQPLLRDRRLDPARRAIRVAQVGRDQSEAALRRAIVETAAAVEQAYWTLVAAEREIEIRRTAVALAERQREDVQARIDGKVVPEADLAQPVAEIERRKGDLLAAVEARARAEHALKALMLDRADAPLWDVPLRTVDRPEMPPVAVDLQAALADAATLRPELADVEARAALQAIEIDAARDRLKPRLDLVGSIAARGLAGEQHDGVRAFPGLPLVFPDALRGAAGTSIENLLRARFPDAVAGVTLTVPLGQRAARADLAVAESGRRQVDALRQRLLLRIAVEVRNAATALETAVQRVDAARATREAAAVQLQAEQDRFTAGITTSFFVLTRQNDLATAQVAESAALAAYRRALAELSRARGTLLRDRRIDWRPLRDAESQRP